MPINLRKALWLQLTLFGLLSATEQLSSQLLPHHYRDFRYDILNFMKQSKEVLYIVSPHIDDTYLRRTVIPLMRKGISMYIVINTVSQTIKELALLKGVHIYLSTTPINGSILLSNQSQFFLSLPLDREQTQRRQGYYFIDKDSESYNRKLDETLEQIRNASPYLH